MSQQHRARAAAIGIQSTLVGVLANVLIAAVMAIAGIPGISCALIADAIESASDVGSSLVMLDGHEIGHGVKESIIRASGSRMFSYTSSPQTF